MRNLKLGASLAGLVLATMWLTGCDDNGQPSSGTTSNAGTTGTNVPITLAGKSITHTITVGTDPFPSTGGFVLQLGGTPGVTAGDFVSIGTGGVTNTTGTYTFVVTSGSTATLQLQDSALGEITEIMTFQTPFSGTFSSSRSAGGTESGSFITN